MSAKREYEEAFDLINIFTIKGGKPTPLGVRWIA